MSYEERKAKAFELIRKDDYRKAFEEFSILFYENPKDPELIEVSIFLLDRIFSGDYDFQPQTGEEYVYRGIAKFYHNEFDSSIADYDKALLLNPKLDYALKCKAFSLRFKKDFSQSIKVLNYAIQIKPRGEYFDDLAEVYSIIGDNKNAIINHEKAIHYSPEDARLWYNYGTHLGEVGQIEKAIIMFDKAINLWPQYEDALYNREVYLNRLKKK
jgi:tetratricopeptide (TPR) repeat protein